MKKVFLATSIVLIGLASCTSKVDVKYRCCNNTYTILTDNYNTPDDFALNIPQAFTPNGDGKNDLFFPIGKGFTVDQVLIKRNGKEVFNSADHVEYFWDASGAKDGRYNYTMKLTTDAGSQIELKGDVCVMRFGTAGDKLPELEQVEICDCLTADMIDPITALTDTTASTNECVIGAGS